MKFISSDTSPISDAELIEKYRDTLNNEYVGELYNRYIHLVYGLCIKYLKSKVAAQDAVMNLFELVLEKLKTHEVTYFKSWLYMVAKNHCLMELRKNKGEVFMESVEIAHPIEDEHELESDLVALEKCIGELREAQQQCVRSFFLEEKSYQEIVDQTSYKMSKVKSYIQNGKRNLKICLEKNNVKR